MNDDETGLAEVIAHEGWGELVLNRPARRNALIGPMVGEMRAGLATLLAGGAKVILLRGAGGVFCSGLDIDAFGAQPPPAWRAAWAETWSEWHKELYRCPAVIVGALERYAINGGASMALACDLLVAGEGAELLVGEAAQGMHAPMNLAWLRIRASEAVAAQVALGAGRLKGADLKRLGLAYEVAPDADVGDRARALSERLAGFPGNGLAAIKASLRAAARVDGEAIFEAVKQTGVATAALPSRIGKS